MSEAIKETYDCYTKFMINNPDIILDPVAESKMLTQLYQRVISNKGDEINAPKKTNT